MRPNRLMGIVSVALGVAVAIVALLGPLALDVIRYRISDNMENQQIGVDLTGLLLVTPLAVVAGTLWWRGHRLAPVVALGPGVFTAYMFFQYITGPEYLRYDGNNEQFFPLLYGVLLAGIVVSIAAWSGIGSGAGTNGLPLPPRGMRLTTAGILLASGGFLALAWSKWVYDIARGVTTTDYLEQPAASWIVKTMDLAIVIPAAIATGAGLLLRRPAAVKAAYGLVPAFALLASGVAAMAIVMIARDDPSASPAFVAVLAPAALGMAALTRSLWRSYLSAAGERDRPQPEPPVDKEGQHERPRRRRQPARQHA